MGHLKTLLFSVILSVVLFYFNANQLLEKYLKKDNKSKVNLVIGVLSARGNFEYRNSVRKSFNQQLSKLNHKTSVTRYFIVGDTDCLYPKEDRINEFSCVKWDVGYNNNNLELGEVMSMTIRNETDRTVISCKEAMVIERFSFKVGKFGIRIHKLGILASVLIPNEPVFIILMDKFSKEIFAKAKFLIDTNFKEEYFYSSVDEFIYPPGFNGLVTIKGTILDNTSVCSEAVRLNSGGNIIIFTAERDRIPVTAIGFRIHNASELKEHVENAPIRLRKWRDKIANITLNLKQEQALYQDIIFVNLVDVYRNLPVKLLKFFTWLINYHDFDYFLKTDDDCSLNIELVTEKLRDLDKNSKKVWWGNFHQDWLVNRFGKWADEDYPSSFYPIFACGSGNTLSKYLVNWLVQNQQHLHPFQGEDVSLGIWLSALLPQYIDDKKWSCDEDCDKDSYVRAQMTVDQMRENDKLIQQCGSICSCNNE